MTKCRALLILLFRLVIAADGMRSEDVSKLQLEQLVPSHSTEVDEGDSLVSDETQLVTVSHARGITDAARLSSSIFQIRSSAELAGRSISLVWQKPVEQPRVEAKKPGKIDAATAVVPAVSYVLCFFALSVVVGLFYSDGKRIPIGDVDEQAVYTEFSSGILNCFDEPEVCLCACCCPTVRWSLTVSLVQKALSFWVAFAVISSFSVPLSFIKTMDLEYYKNNVERRAWESQQNQDGASTSQHWMSAHGLPAEHNWLEALMQATWLGSVLVGVVFRQKLRQVFDMEQGPLTFVQDFAAHCVCCWCAVAQEARHVQKARRNGHVGCIVGDPVAVN